MVSQENDEVFSRLSVVENITMMQTDISQMLVKSELSKYGMQDILDKTPAKMSGGEKRIFPLARQAYRGAENRRESEVRS